MISLDNINRSLQEKFTIVLPIDPVPASRPRASQRGKGHGYTETHNKFRLSASAWLLPLRDQLLYPAGNHVGASIEFLVEKPESSRLLAPRGDLDNYIKITLDCLTDMQCLWEDDIQLVSLTTSKRFAKDTPPGIIITSYVIPDTIL